MDTQVRTPQAIFMQPQRLLVPLFQRPYVWNEELQWEPLWKDLERVATRLLHAPGTPQAPHFLGAVVLQQLLTQTSDLQQRTLIDGQQRLTTLQLLLDALHSEIAMVGATMPAARLEPLTERTVTDPRRVLAIVAAVREQGFSLVDEELELGLRSLSVPLRGPEGRPVAALNLCAAAARVSANEMRVRYLSAMRSTADTISTAWLQKT